MNKIITIGREFGSGGREFGRRLAEGLGIEYYDKEIINKCKEVLKFKEGNIYWQLLNNCGLLPLEFIINLQGE